MEVVRFHERVSRILIQHAVKILHQGGVIAYPTETTYGLGCDPRNEAAIKKIYRIKGRKKTKSVILVAASMAQAKKVARIEASAMRIAKRHWPGPLTLVLPVGVPLVGTRSASRPGQAQDLPLPHIITPKDYVAIRVSSSPIVQALTRAFGFPIVSTSANHAGQPDARSGRAVMNYFVDERCAPDLLLDGGALPRRVPSTVARIHPHGRIEILRQGRIRLPSSL